MTTAAETQVRLAAYIRHICFEEGHRRTSTKNLQGTLKNQLAYTDDELTLAMAEVCALCLYGCTESRSVALAGSLVKKDFSSAWFDGAVDGST